MRVLIIGCGYVGVPLAARLAAQNHEVFGLRRSSEADSELAALNIIPLHADITDPADLARIAPRFDWVVNLVSSTRGGVEEYRNVYLQGTRNLIEWLRSDPPAHYLYTSSTSVYGQTDGSWVDENSPAIPASGTSRVLVETENLLLEQATLGFPATILRVAGIYGPGRGHLFQQFLKGDARIHGAGDRILNMIHLEDLVNATITALERARPGELWNITDNEPLTESQFFEYLAQRMNRPLPPRASPEELAKRKRGFTSKRVSNRKARTQLNFAPAYPTFREGYESEIRTALLKEKSPAP